MQNMSLQTQNENLQQQANGQEVQSIVAATQFRAHAGPLPDAQSFLEYKNVREDLPDLIIAEWLKESESRRSFQARQIELQDKEISKSHTLECWKLLIVGLFCLGMLCIAGWLAFKGAYVVAASVVSLPTLIGVIDAIRNPKIK